MKFGFMENLSDENALPVLYLNDNNIKVLVDIFLDF